MEKKKKVVSKAMIEKAKEGLECLDYLQDKTLITKKMKGKGV